jgi:hypothetical protein
MRSRVSILCTVFLLLAMVPAPLAGAKQPLDVEFQVTVLDGSFIASGPAVTEGLMCISGTVENPKPDKFVGNSEIVSNAQVVTVFTCDDGGALDGDTFVVKHQLHIDLTVEPVTWTINWVVLRGTGEFAHLHGNGHGTGELLTEFPFGPFDTLAGQLH